MTPIEKITPESEKERLMERLNALTDAAEEFTADLRWCKRFGALPKDYPADFKACELIGLVDELREGLTE